MTKRNLLLGGLILIGLLGWLALTVAGSAPKPPLAILPSPSPSPETTALPAPRPTLGPIMVSVPPNPQHGIHAPVGNQWTDGQRQALEAFQNSAGEQAGPGLLVALSSDMTAANNSQGRAMELDLLRYAQAGSQIYIRMYPQRFPGGLTEPLERSNGRNSISGTPEDVAEDIFRFLQGQQQRTGQHFNQIIPGNEPNLEWPNANYYQNVLAWQSSDDPTKYEAVNAFMLKVYQAWQSRLARPDAVLFRDVRLYFPAMAQDGHPDYFGGAYFYADNRPTANKYDKLRPAIELFGRFSWHNYFRPGRAWDDRAVAAFPDWLRQGLANGWPALISEAGWTPDALALPTRSDGPAFIARFWQRLNWSKELARDDRPYWRTQDETIAGVTFESDIEYFITECAGVYDAARPKLRPGVAVWLAGSEGNFTEAIGVEPGPNGAIRRWLTRYGLWKI